jgi:hypothetical protein
VKTSFLSGISLLDCPSLFYFLIRILLRTLLSCGRPRKDNNATLARIFVSVLSLKIVELLKRVREQEGIVLVAMVEYIRRALVGLTDKAVVLYQGRKFLEAPTSEALTIPE